MGRRHVRGPTEVRRCEDALKTAGTETPQGNVSGLVCLSAIAAASTSERAYIQVVKSAVRDGLFAWLNGGDLRECIVACQLKLKRRRSCALFWHACWYAALLSMHVLLGIISTLFVCMLSVFRPVVVLFACPSEWAEFFLRQVQEVLFGGPGSHVTSLIEAAIFLVRAYFLHPSSLQPR